MSDIDFLAKEKHDQEQKPEEKEEQKEELIWSTPEKDKAGSGAAPFSVFSFLKKKTKGEEEKPGAIDKNKIKESRQEILQLIKNSENSEVTAEKKTKRNILSNLKEKLKKQPDHKEILIDYQQVFNQEKNKRNWPTEAIKQPLASKKENQENNKAKPDLIREKAEPTPTVKEKQEIEIEQPKEEAAAPVILETNLMKGELITYFDWQRQIIILASAVLIPLVLVGAIYLGVMFYQKESLAKNQDQAKKTAELSEKIELEEANLKPIIDFQNQLKLVSQIFAQHLYWTNFLKFLEDNTIKEVYFTGFAGDTSGSYSLEALGANYGSIAEQVDSLKGNKLVTEAEASGGELVAGDSKNSSRIKFNLKFSILKDIFIQ